MSDDTSLDPQKIWRKVVTDLATGISDPEYTITPLTQRNHGWIKLIKPHELNEDTFHLSVPTSWALEQIEKEKLHKSIKTALNHNIPGNNIQISITVVPQNTQKDDQLPIEFHPFFTQGETQKTVHKEQTNTIQKSTAINNNFNVRYTFDNFIIGPSNRFAHAAAVAVSEQPAQSYNPLFIWGGSGLGKTHLLHACGNYTQQLFPHMRIKYVSTEEFTNDFINSIRDKNSTDFKKKYRNMDVLLIDDIQFIEGREQTQEEFFHTFNTLHNNNKQIVISSDRSPKKLSTLEDRLRTRFEWGLITDIQPPDLETRIAILRKKSQIERLSISEDVLEFIASNIERNIRELEGALIRVTAFASLNKIPINRTLAESILNDLISHPTTTTIDPSIITNTVANYFNVTVEEICGSGKSQPLAQARQIAMYLCRELTELSLPKIGQKFNRDHTTVMYADKKIRKNMTQSQETFNQITEITALIRQQTKN